MDTPFYYQAFTNILKPELCKISGYRNGK